MPPQDPSVIRAAELLQRGQPAQAEPLLRRRVRQAPADSQANRLLAIALITMGQHVQAEYFARRALELQPDAPAWDALGTALVVQGKLREAAEAFEQGIALAPNLPSLHNGLGGARLNLREYAAAATAFARARAIDPANVIYWRQHVAALIRALAAPEALALLREAVAKFPDDALLRTQMVSSLNYASGISREEVFEHHAALGRLLERQGGPRPAFTNAKDPNRPIRVGLLSADWFEHPVAHFVSPLFTHPTPGIELRIYDASLRRDDTTRRLRAALPRDAWREVERQTDAAIAQQMRADAIDVAVDLAGHTLDSRVGVMAFHPAPVGITYLGYPNTTGLSRVAWRLVDTHTDPPGTERWNTERLLRLDPCFLCFPPPPHAPDVSPRAPGQPLTFVSFNNPAKLSAETFELWSGVLAAVPASRLLLKGVGLDAPFIRDRVLRDAQAAGIDPARVECLPITATPREHLASYARGDIALDTFPYHGTTTTCEALWMGVPVITRAGDTHASRVGVSLLHACGLPDLIADSPAAFTRIAADLASDPARLATLRSTLRPRLAASPLGDVAAGAARLAGAIRAAWQDYCRAP